MTAGDPADLTSGEFEELFQRFAQSPTATSAFRWEARQYYLIPWDEPSLVAFQTGTARPERSVRTSPWLARIATSRAAGRDWSRVRHVVEPLSEYVRWEMVSYVESQAAGERILVTIGNSVPTDADYWLFDGDDIGDRYAIVMHYAEDGAPERFELTTDHRRFEELSRYRDGLLAEAIPLNEYLARDCGRSGGV